MKEYVIEGHDGSAKTPIAQGVKKILMKRGMNVEVYAPFQIVNERIQEPDIYLYWEKEENAKRAIHLLSDAIGESRKDAKSKGIDVLIYDRHWLTVLGEIDHRPELAKLWSDFLPTFFIQAPPSKTIDCQRFSYGIPWTSSLQTIQNYYDRYINLASKYSTYIVDTYRVEQRTQPLEPIIQSIVDHILS